MVSLSLPHAPQRTLQRDLLHLRTLVGGVCSISSFFPHMNVLSHLLVLPFGAKRIHFTFLLYFCAHFFSDHFSRFSYSYCVFCAFHIFFSLRFVLYSFNLLLLFVVVVGVELLFFPLPLFVDLRQCNFIALLSGFLCLFFCRFVRFTDK